MALLKVLDLGKSNKDPLAEWSEHLVAALLDGTLAASPVQKDYDLTTPAGEKVQVRYLANRSGLPGAWVNEHRVISVPGVDRYALVVFEGFRPLAVLVFPFDLTQINAALKKKAPKQDYELQFTRANFLQIMGERQRFQELGMQIWQPPMKSAEN